MTVYYTIQRNSDFRFASQVVESQPGQKEALIIKGYLLYIYVLLGGYLAVTTALRSAPEKRILAGLGPRNGPAKGNFGFFAI